MNRVRRIANERSIGHLGTLDPMGTGVLPLLVGPATRLAKFFTLADKVYEVRVRFGFATNTYDRTGERVGDEHPVTFSPEDLTQALAQFKGRILQLPPNFSAKKIQGVPAYKLARANKDVNLAPVEIEIFNIEILAYENPEATLRVHCGSGTYVRSIAHDLGQVLGGGAHLTALRRTRSGDFSIEQATTLEQLEIIPAAQLLPQFPPVTMDATAIAQIHHGRNFRAPTEAPSIKVLDESGTLVAIAEAVLPNLYHPTLVFPKSS